MRAVILAGGLGTRLRPYTIVLPKPLVPIGDRPVLDVVMRQLRAAGFEHVTVATGYLAELIEAFFRDGGEYGMTIDYYREHEPLGTVGALGLMDGIDDHVLVMNGDVLSDLDYQALIADHRASGAAATIASHRRREQVTLGVLVLDEDDPRRLTGYREKPAYEFDVSMGVYCFAPRALEHINAGERLDFPDLVLRLLAAGEEVRAFPWDGYWLDIGRHDDYEQASEEFERMRGRLLPDE